MAKHFEKLDKSDVKYGSINPARVNPITTRNQIRRLLYEKTHRYDENGLPQLDKRNIFASIPREAFVQILSVEAQRLNEQLEKYQFLRKVKVLTQCRIPFDSPMSIDLLLKKKYALRYSKDVCGIIMSFENVKVLTEKLMVDYSNYFYPIWIEFECYVFNPIAGTVGLGVVYSKNESTIQLLWNGCADVVLDKSANRDFWTKYDEIEIGSGIYFRSKSVRANKRMVIVQGQAILDKEIVHDEKLKKTVIHNIKEAENQVKEDAIYEYSESESESSSSADSEESGSQSDNDNEEIEDVEPETLDMENDEEEKEASSSDSKAEVEENGRVSKADDSSVGSKSSKASTKTSVSSASENSSSASEKLSSTSENSSASENSSSASETSISSNDSESSPSNSVKSKKRKHESGESQQNKRRKVE